MKKEGKLIKQAARLDGPGSCAMEGGMKPKLRLGRRSFMLAAGDVYLNAGTFSALPRVVFNALVRELARAESNPTRIAAGNIRAPLWAAQQAVAAYVGADPLDLLFRENVTQALNLALFSLPWEKGGEFLVTDHEYGAIVNAVREMARRRGLSVRVVPLPRDPRDGEELVGTVLRALSSRTTGILMSHVMTATGLVMPIERIAKALRHRGVRLLVDGAHGPGLVPLRLASTEIDVYGGNLHKWFMGPKGTGFLYVNRRLQPLMEPLVVGWGGTPRDRRVPAGPGQGNAEGFQQVFQMQGLRDSAPFLALKATIDFRRKHGEAAILRRLRELGVTLRKRLEGELGLACLSPRPGLQAGLFAFCPPPAWRRPDASERLFRKHRITVPFWEEPAHGFLMRVSPHVWNNERDIDRLITGLRADS